MLKVKKLFVPITTLILLCFVSQTGCPAVETRLKLPPDPGEAGKATLLGIDSDSDGVRDDIQRYIELTYPDSARKRAAMRQDAKAMNDALKDTGDKRKSIKNAYKVNRAQEFGDFIWQNHGGPADAMEQEMRFRKAVKERRKLLARFLNTQERNSTYFDYDSQLGGEVFSSTPLKFEYRSCEFDPDQLPD